MMTYDELTATAAEEVSRQQRYPHCLRVCMAAGCLSQHHDTIKTALEDAVKEAAHESSGVSRRKLNSAKTASYNSRAHRLL